MQQKCSGTKKKKPEDSIHPPFLHVLLKSPSAHDTDIMWDSSIKKLSFIKGRRFGWRDEREMAFYVSECLCSSWWKSFSAKNRKTLYMFLKRDGCSGHFCVKSLNSWRSGTASKMDSESSDKYMKNQYLFQFFSMKKFNPLYGSVCLQQKCYCSFLAQKNSF